MYIRREIERSVKNARCNGIPVAACSESKVSLDWRFPRLLVSLYGTLSSGNTVGNTRIHTRVYQHMQACVLELMLRSFRGVNNARRCEDAERSIERAFEIKAS